MPIALQGTPSLYENASSATAVIPYPAGVTAGEVLLAQVIFSASTPPTAVPSGWNLVKTQDGGAAVQGGFWYRIADGTETGSVTFTSPDAAGRTTGMMQRWSGVDTTTPLDVGAAGVSLANAVSLTITAPSVTTVNDNAEVFYLIGLNSATRDYGTPVGFTRRSSSTGTGRGGFLFTKTKTPAGATGTQDFTTTSGASGLEAIAIVVAIRPSGGGVASDPTLAQRWVGVPETSTATSARVQVKVSLDATSVRLRCSTDSAGTTGVVYGAAVTPSARGNATLTATGLTANTRYYYRVMMTGPNGEVADVDSIVGRLKTAPSGAGTFSFSFGSCANGSTATAWDAIAARNDDMFLQIGDFYYADNTGTNEDNFRSKMGGRVTAFPNVFAKINTSYTPSDHDGMTNNGSAGSDPTAWTNWNTVRAEMAPMPASYYAWTWGRVRFLQLDTRSWKDAPADTDNSSKDALGATQKQWLKDQITAATEPLIIIAQADPWIGPAEAGNDSWAGYSTERAELAGHFAASGKNIVMLAGDMHALAADNGTNALGGITVLHASPMWNSASIKGGPYSAGTYPTVGGAQVSQYGRVTVTDTGANTLQMDFVGYDATTDSSVFTYSETFNAIAPTVVLPTGIATAKAVGTPTVTGTTSLQPAGIPTARAVGTVTIPLKPTGIPTAKAVGTPVIPLKPTGIPSAKAFGTPTLTTAVTTTAVGITSLRAVGSASVTALAVSRPTGIVTRAAFGSPAAKQGRIVLPTGIPRSGLFQMGEPALLTTVSVQANGIITAAAVGTPVAFRPVPLYRGRATGHLEPARYSHKPETRGATVMNTYPRETVEFQPITITREGVPLVTTEGLSFAVVPDGSRPETFTAPAVLADRSGVMISGLTPGAYRIYARLLSTPEIPVIDCGYFYIN